MVLVFSLNFPTFSTTYDSSYTSLLFKTTVFTLIHLPFMPSILSVFLLYFKGKCPYSKLCRIKKKTGCIFKLFVAFDLVRVIRWELEQKELN